MKNSQKTNEELCADFRNLLTHGFYVANGRDTAEILRVTKAWRGDMWRAFGELEDRLCPNIVQERINHAKRK